MAKSLHEIDRIIEYLREVAELIKACEKMFDYLDGLLHGTSGPISRQPSSNLTNEMSMLWRLRPMRQDSTAIRK